MPHIPHVIHLVPSLAHGGLERLVVDWTNARNVRHPASTSVVCLDEPGELASLVLPEVGARGSEVRDQTSGGVSCVHADRSLFPWDGRAVRRLRRKAEGGKLKALSPIIHSHNLAAQQYAALACLGTRVRHVNTEHGSKEHVRGWKNRLRNRGLARMTDRVVAVSESVAEAMVTNEGISLGRVRVIANGIAPEKGPSRAAIAALKDELQIPGSVPVIGTVGRLATVKGQDRLLTAFAALRKSEEGDQRSEIRGERSVFRLLFVGDGPEKARLEQMAHTLDIAGEVIFTGYRADARRLIAAMDLFVLPSRSEGLSIALLEAMDAGVPVMATDVGESRAVLEDGACGVVLTDDDTLWGDMISDQLAVISGAETRAEVDRARRRVAECYSQDVTLDAYENIYGELSES